MSEELITLFDKPVTKGSEVEEFVDKHIGKKEFDEAELEEDTMDLYKEFREDRTEYWNKDLITYLGEKGVSDTQIIKLILKTREARCLETLLSALFGSS